MRLPARSILVAAGTQPNTVLAREDPDNVFLDGRYFQAVDEDGQPVKPERVSKPKTAHVLTSLRPDGRAISFFGDLHPSFAGNVVKAMASAKQGYPVVSRHCYARPPAGPPAEELLDTLNNELRARRARSRAPDAEHRRSDRACSARRARFQAGPVLPSAEFRDAAPHERRRIEREQAAARNRLAMEGLALTGASVDREEGLLSTIVLEMGGSSDLCAQLKPGEPVILMGPTGTPTETPARETVLLVGGGLGNAVLFSIGQELRAQGSRTVYFAGYKKIIDRYKIEEIEKAADVVIWCCDEAPGFTPGRSRRQSFRRQHRRGDGRLRPRRFGRGRDSTERGGSRGRDRLRWHDGARCSARHRYSRRILKPEHKAIGSINSPMQCMMKEICAQCLQLHKDPKTGEETVVFSCFNQDQSLDHVDCGVLRTRLSQNGVQEKLTRQWIDRCLIQIGAREALV